MATGIWQNPDVVAKLCAALRHLTGDQWSFDFKAAGNKAPIGERQIPLGFANSKKFAVPYSEGLDSRAVSALSGTEDDALDRKSGGLGKSGEVRVGLGGGRLIKKKQKIN